ncbi:MAG: asparagine synthase (glutamine-hydrolyzing) [Micavibrio sp.]|nr:asparagine synthase (glutamine-hydrolyzing) [Micavibrio sp.]
MCGIGFVFGPGANGENISAILDAQHHRGPDARETKIYETDQIALGFNRLSILDLSSAGMQPMISASGRYTMVFNGEIYNYKELKTQLQDYPYQSTSDSEVLLAAWEKWGTDCLPKFIGMFAIAIWDCVEKRLIIARDCLGIKPLYYTVHNKTLYGASEIKSLLAAGIPADHDWEIWGDYFRYGVYNHSQRTFFSNILSLEPGHYVSISLTDIQSGRAIAPSPYWKRPSQPTYFDANLSEEALSDLLWQELENSVKLHLRSDVPIGLNLSGGMDSATLCMLMDTLSSPDVDLSSYTIGYGEPQYDEIIYADLIPKTRQWKRHEVSFSAQDSIEHFHNDIYTFEEPIGGIATQAYKKLHQYARSQGVTVLLEGQGIDELLGGYGYYKTLLGEANSCKTNTGAANQKDGTPLFYQDNTKFLAPELIDPGGPISQSNLRDFKAPFDTAVENAMYADLFHRRVPRVLRMNDRLSMAHSIELREPFLTHVLVDFCAKIRPEHKVTENQAKSILKKALDKRAPDFAKTCEQKRAVSAPQREWLRKEMKDMAWDLLGSKEFTQSGAFKVKDVHQAYDHYIKYGAENSFFIWQWMNFAAWCKVFKP